MQFHFRGKKAAWNGFILFILIIQPSSIVGIVFQELKQEIKSKALLQGVNNQNQTLGGMKTVMARMHI